MLKGHFENCYGLNNFDLTEINFTSSNNKAIIYAPNGIMKSSLAKVFDDISKKKKASDRIFTEKKASFNVEYYNTEYTNVPKKISPPIYVISSFDASFESYSDSVATILADEDLKKEYSLLLQSIAEKVQPLKDCIANHFIAKSNIEQELSNSFCNSPNQKWEDIILKINDFNTQSSPIIALSSFMYDDIFNDKVLKVISTPGFADKIKQYINAVDILVKQSKILTTVFDDTNAKEFSSTVEKTKLFEAKHKIVLSDGTTIATIDEWKQIFQTEMDRINNDATVKAIYSEIDKALGANIQTRKLRDLIKNNHFILNYFDDIQQLKKQLIVAYLAKDNIDIKTISDTIEKKTKEITVLNEKAKKQLEHWKQVIEVFRTRFHAPFDVSIENESKVILQGEPARLKFTYCKNGESRAKSKEELMEYLSVGEKRALYLLQILFDLEKIKLNVNTTGKKHLIIADDLADSFDYSNKYAIIEYLDEISSNKLIDVLILTHNFDFYRTVASRLDIKYTMCYMAQRDSNGNISMQPFAYKKDYFTNGIIENIRDGNIKDNFEKQKLLIASIPFCRNISQYLDNKNITEYLTSLLHIKPNTFTITVEQFWNKIKEMFSLKSLDCDNYKSKSVVNLIFDLADRLILENTDNVSLPDKLVTAIAIRLKTEQFLYKVLTKNNIDTVCDEYQTRMWIERTRSKNLLSPIEMEICNRVRLITPESIHVNAFMYEPLIDIPNWQLFELYREVKTKLCS